jgi:transcriptional regulator with XRE-family HTH domain
MPDSRSFQQHLRLWRQARGTSQLDLAGEAGVSTRHLSFLETGRAKPSRDMVGRLAEALDLPLRARNDFLLSAGFAPQFGARPLDDAELQEARRALQFLLRMHEPYPAFVIDGEWTIVMQNAAQERLFRLLLPNHVDRQKLNALDLVLNPGLMRERIANWDEVASAVLRRLRRQLAGRPDDARIQTLWERVRRSPGVAELAQMFTREHSPILVPVRIEYESRALSWFSTLAVFGATGEVTLEELVIESFFPADEATRRFVEELGPAPG